MGYLTERVISDYTDTDMKRDREIRSFRMWVFRQIFGKNVNWDYVLFKSRVSVYSEDEWESLAARFYIEVTPEEYIP